MIRQRFKLRQWGWGVTVFYAVTTYWTDEIISSLKRAGCDGQNLRNAHEQLSLGKLDTGLTFSNKERGETVMVIALTSSTEEFVKSWTHEMGHLKDHIASTYGISSHGEEIQYLGDDIITEMWDVAHQFVCCKCRPKRSH